MVMALSPWLCVHQRLSNQYQHLPLLWFDYLQLNDVYIKVHHNSLFHYNQIMFYTFEKVNNPKVDFQVIWKQEFNNEFCDLIRNSIDENAWTDAMIISFGVAT